MAEQRDETTQGAGNVTDETPGTGTKDTGTKDTGTKEIGTKDTVTPGTGALDMAALGPAYTVGPLPDHVDAGVDDPAPPTRRRGPDPLALLVGLATLAMAVFAFVGELPDLPDPRWLLAGGAALVGLVLLVGSLRGRSGGRRS